MFDTSYKVKAFLNVYKNVPLNFNQSKAVRDRKLQEVIQHAYRHTAFYRKWMNEARISPDDIKCAEDLKYFPPITRKIIQDKNDAFFSSIHDIEDCKVRTTSGSSGKVLKVYLNKYDYWYRLLLFTRALSMIGYNPLKKFIYYLPKNEKTGLSFGLFRHKYLSPDNTLEEAKKLLFDFKPHIVSLYPSYAMDLAEYLKEDDINKLGIQSLSLSSEMILPDMMKQIESKYQCPAYAEYSTVEFGQIAAMCKNKNYHIFTDNVILEILNEQGQNAEPGETGEVVLTALNSFAMPLIRYRIGDFASLIEKKCSCGSCFPIMGHIEGRNDDSFYLRDGIRIPSWLIYKLIEHWPKNNDIIFLDFFLVQKSRTEAFFYFVAGPDFSKKYIQEIIRRVKRLFGKDFVFLIKKVNHIDFRIKKVKRKYIHCALPDAVKTGEVTDFNKEIFSQPF